MDTRTLHLLEYSKIRELLRPFAASSLGKALIDRLQPVRDVQIIRTRQAETTEARALLTDADAPFGGLKDVRESIHRADKAGTLTPGELLDVAGTAAAFRRLRRYLLREVDRVPKLAVQGRLLGEFHRIEETIDRIIGPNAEVLDHASPELARARQRMRALHESMQRELQRIISSGAHAEHLQDPIITLRNNRFCVPVRAEQRHAFKGIVHDLSASGQTAFMEPMSVVEMGNDLREAERQEQEEVERVLAAASAIVGATAGTFLTSLDAAARLDAIFARARFAHALDAVEPELSADGCIDLRAARHPLLGEIAVPIDFAMGEAANTTVLLTGSNTGGKTVTLKTVGLLVLMAQSGLHLPVAPGSRIATFDEVYADIGDEQSIEQSLSTFSGHLTNIVRILNAAKANTLVLLDEIGAGTDPAEGAALAKAILLELHDRGCRTIATTHYGELKVFAQQTPCFVNASVEFDLETLLPTYRVLVGLPGSSYAFAIAQRLGLPKPLIARARAMIGEAPRALEQVLKEADGVRRALDRERTAAARARREAEEAARRVEQELSALEAARGTAVTRAKKEAQDLLHKARLETNALLDELKAALKQVRTRAGEAPVDPGALRRKASEVLNTLSQQAESGHPVAVRVSDDAPPALTAVRAGDAVMVRSLGHRGTALESGTGEDEVTVQVGIMRVRVPISDLHAAPDKREMPPPITVAETRIDPELHLLGKRAEVAAAELDEYLYNAATGGLAHVRIVHGFGTGALRATVQDVLRRHPLVRGYRQGEPAEGGGGVTIADLK